jgi:hypothetical protein
MIPTRQAAQIAAATMSWRGRVLRTTAAIGRARRSRAQVLTIQMIVTTLVERNPRCAVWPSTSSGPQADPQPTRLAIIPAGHSVRWSLTVSPRHVRQSLQGPGRRAILPRYRSWRASRNADSGSGNRAGSK